MSDLIKVLRSSNDEWQLEAADHIEQLEAALDRIIRDRGGLSGNERKRNIARAALKVLKEDRE